MTNAWHMFALSPSPQGEACSRRLYIAECVSLCIYATEGKVTARCIAMRCPATPGSWGARSHGLSPTRRCHSAVESLPVPGPLEISGAGAGHKMDSEILDLVLCSGRGSCREQRCSSRQHRSHTPRSLTAGVTCYFEKHSNCEEQVRAVQQSVPGVFPQLHYKGFRGPRSGKS